VEVFQALGENDLIVILNVVLLDLVDILLIGVEKIFQMFLELSIVLGELFIDEILEFFQIAAGLDQLGHVLDQLVFCIFDLVCLARLRPIGLPHGQANRPDPIEVGLDAILILGDYLLRKIEQFGLFEKFPFDFAQHLHVLRVKFGNCVLIYFITMFIFVFARRIVEFFFGRVDDHVGLVVESLVEMANDF